MNKKLVAVLFASANESNLNELTLHRTSASLPFGGRYRLIDFTLSSLVNSGVTRIAIITRSNYQSLMDHIRMGRDWDLNRKNSGIAVFPPFVLNTALEVYKGKIEAIYTILDYLKKAPEDYVFISNCNVAGNIDVDGILAEHIEKNADFTVVCHKAQINSSKRIVLEKNEENFATDIYSVAVPSDESKVVSLNMYVASKDVIIDRVEKAYARGHFDFEKDVLFKECASGSKIYVKEITEYAAVIDDVKTYYTENMRLLEGNVRRQLFMGENDIYTKVKDSVPTIYQDKASVKNSIIADGCTINGTVENSILFRDVTVEEGVVIKDCIIMENNYIMKDSRLSNVITDKDVTVRAGRQLSGAESYPIVIVKSKIV